MRPADLLTVGLTARGTTIGALVMIRCEGKGFRRAGRDRRRASGVTCRDGVGLRQALRGAWPHRDGAAAQPPAAVASQHRRGPVGRQIPARGRTPGHRWRLLRRPRSRGRLVALGRRPTRWNIPAPCRICFMQAPSCSCGRGRRSICATGASGGSFWRVRTGAILMASRPISMGSMITLSYTSRFPTQSPMPNGRARSCRRKRNGNLPRAAD